MYTKDFRSVMDRYEWDQVQEQIYSKTEADVIRALQQERRSIDDFIALISPAAKPYLELMAVQSQRLTQQRFGKTIQLYAPMYLSNECQNICTYCGFSMDNGIRRKTLSTHEMDAEANALKEMGFEHVLLVTGEASKAVGMLYFLQAIEQLKTQFAHISMEVQPLEEEAYRLLHQAGVQAILVYQETYHRSVYKQYHPKGKKSNFDYRLDTPDRIGRAGIHKMGLGVLLGLEDWRTDSFFNALHIDYLQRTYWQSKYSVSFPRLRPAEGVIEPNFIMEDKDLLQLICAYRLWNPDLELSLSTREREHFRNHAIGLGITSMSAGSKTNPGGYTVDPQSLMQFETSDERPVSEIRELIQQAGYDPVWKDWDQVFTL